MASREKELMAAINNLVNVEYKGKLIGEDIELIKQFPGYEKYIRTIIAVHNSELLIAKKRELADKSAKVLALHEPALGTVKKEKLVQPEKKEEQREFSFYDLTYKKYEELKLLCESEKDVFECLNDGDNDTRTISLLLYKDINDLTASIRKKIVLNPYEDISADQSEIKRLSMIFKAVRNYNKSMESNTVSLPNIILLEDSKGNDSIYDYIVNNINVIPKVKKNLKKFFRGEVSKTKKLIGKDGLLESKDLNGTRLLYFDLGNNNYVLARLFIKDATKSLKINAIYDKAIADFKEQEDYIRENLNNEEFKSRQCELINRLFTFLNKGDEVITSGRKI